MFKIIFSVIILCTASAGFAQSDAEQIPKANLDTQKWVSHLDTANYITVEYPANWVLKTSNQKAAFMVTSPVESVNDIFKENINVIVKQLPNAGVGTKLQDIVNAVEAKIPTSVDNFVKYYSKTVKWLGVDAQEFSYGGKSKTEGKEVVFMQRIAINLGRLVLATYTSEGGKEDIYKETAFKIIRTIKCD
jgi:hypothetical protein